MCFAYAYLKCLHYQDFNQTTRQYNSEDSQFHLIVVMSSRDFNPSHLTFCVLSSFRVVILRYTKNWCSKVVYFFRKSIPKSIEFPYFYGVITLQSVLLRQWYKKSQFYR